MHAHTWTVVSSTVVSSLMIHNDISICAMHGLNFAITTHFHGIPIATFITVPNTYVLGLMISLLHLRSNILGLMISLLYLACIGKSLT